MSLRSYIIYIMQYCAIHANFSSKKEIVIPFKNADIFSPIANKDLSTIEAKVCFHSPCCCVWFFTNVLLWAQYGKAVWWSAVKMQRWTNSMRINDFLWW